MIGIHLNLFNKEKVKKEQTNESTIESDKSLAPLQNCIYKGNWKNIMKSSITSLSRIPVFLCTQFNKLLRFHGQLLISETVKKIIL